MSGRGRAPAAECGMCGKAIAARAWHYVVERDSGAWDVWCYRCAASRKAHRKLAPRCRQYLCDIWYLHPGYRLLICDGRSTYRHYVSERAL